MRFKQLASSKVMGSFYTPLGMADDLANHMLLFQKHLPKTILDPAVGDGRLIDSLLESLPDSNGVEVWAYDLDGRVLAETALRLTKKYPSVAFHFFDEDLIDSFLEGKLLGLSFDAIIANPPYLRTQVLGDKAKSFSKKFNLSGRIDAYYIFITIAIELLSEDGVAGFITSNRFMKVKSGANLRNLLLNSTHIYEIVDYGDTKLFDAAVLPSAFIFSLGKTDPDFVQFHSIYEVAETATPVIERDFPYEAMRDDCSFEYNDRSYHIEHGCLAVNKIDGTWSVESDESREWLETVDASTFMRLGDLGKIRVGIKTTADNVFIIKDPDLMGEGLPELVRPLLTHRNAGQICGKEEPRWMVVYPHKMENGRRGTYDLDQYPLTRNYLLQFYEQLESRSYLKKSNRQWFEIWVPQNPDRWKRPKIVFRDIADCPQFWLDSTGAVVNGDCYWIDMNESITSDTIYLALGLLNSSFITEYYDRRVNNKLYAGKRRFMTQYVEQFPLPNPASRSAKEIVGLVGSVLSGNSVFGKRERKKLDGLVYTSFGL